MWYNAQTRTKKVRGHPMWSHISPPRRKLFSLRNLIRGGMEIKHELFVFLLFQGTRHIDRRGGEIEESGHVDERDVRLCVVKLPH